MRAGDAHCRAALVSSGESPGVEVCLCLCYFVLSHANSGPSEWNNVAFEFKVIVTGGSCG